jgi:hypothetical protein
MIKITNDGKRKHNSFMAEAHFELLTGNGSQLNIGIVGYGATEAEALKDFSIHGAQVQATAEQTFKHMLSELEHTMDMAVDLKGICI